MSNSSSIQEIKNIADFDDVAIPLQGTQPAKAKTGMPSSSDQEGIRLLAARCLERAFIALGGIAAMILGAWLFVNGSEHGGTSDGFLGFVVSGQGPGLAFMAAGIWLLYRCLKAEMTIKIVRQDDSAAGRSTSEATFLAKPYAPGDVR